MILAALALAAAPAEGPDAIAVFRDACITGEARFAAGQATPVGYAELPGSVRSYLRSGAGRYYRLSLFAKPAWLAVDPSFEGDLGTSHACTLVAADVTLATAYKRLLPMNPRTADWTYGDGGGARVVAPGGYLYDFRRLGAGYVALQSQVREEPATR